MSDVEGWKKRQQELRNALGDTPALFYFRSGSVCDVEWCFVDGDRRVVKQLTAEKALDVAHQLTGLALHAMKMRERARE